MHVIALIPARGGSKGIPNKNIKMYCGKPLIAWTIDIALKCKLINEVIVSTDSIEIKKIAEKHGATVPFLRPVEISGDLSTDLECFVHFLENVEKPDLIVHLRPTYPNRKLLDLENCIKIMMETNYDSLRTVIKGYSSVFKHHLIVDGKLKPLFPSINNINEPYNQCRQILPDCYMQNACIDIIRPEIILKGSMTGESIYPYIMTECNDIDTLTDWNISENIFKKYLKNLNMFQDLFIFEMANNHGGDINHGKLIIENMAKLCVEYGINNAAIKFQFRDLDTFIHPLADPANNKHIKRFADTRLNLEEFTELKEYAQSQGLKTMCTPFDENSVDKILQLDFDYIKIGSPSLKDVSLLEKVCHTRKPIVVSTGGLDITEIDKLVSFFDNRYVKYALMYCVSIYPTPNAELNLNQIQLLKERYSHIEIGYSTHEDPNNTIAIGLAYALGARLFEKHVNVESDKFNLNLYSGGVNQIKDWLIAYNNAKLMLGSNTYRTVPPEEKECISKLYRGVFVNKDIKQGTVITPDDIYFAFPIVQNGITINQSYGKLIANKDYSKNEAITIDILDNIDRYIIPNYIHKIKALLRINKVHLSHEFNVEISHHYGIEKLYDYGCTIITCFENNEYAKKLIVQLKGQTNPEHYHKQKDETFHVLHGTLIVYINGKKFIVNEGEFIRCQRGTVHSFTTDTDVIVEEISSPIKSKDSYYLDKNLIKDRKTYLHNWGLYQFNN